MRRSSSWMKLNPRSRSQAGLRLLFAFLIVLLCSAPSIPRAATFTATLDRETVTVGETATLTLKFEGGTPKSIPSLPAIPNLQIGAGMLSQSFNTDFNGQSSSAISQSFVLTPAQPGVYNIPAFQAEVDGRVLKTQPLKLTAVKADSSAANAAGEKLAFFKLFVPKKEVYVGEVLAVEFQVYIRDGVANGEGIMQEFDRYGGCPVKAEGVSIFKTAHTQRRGGRVGNANYSVATLVTSLSPIKTGPLTLGSMDVTLPLQIPLPNQRPDFWGRVRVEERRVALSAEPETLTVLPLPKENVPANFNSAVGNFSMSVTAGPTNVAAGDPVTVRIQISGRGTLDSLTL